MALTAALAAAAVLQGGYWPSQRLLVAIAFGGLALAYGRWGPDRRVLAGAAVIAGGVVLSAFGSGVWRSAGVPLLVLIAGVGAYTLARRVTDDHGTVVAAEAIVGLGALVGVIGLVALAWHVSPLALRADTWRLASTLTYQNAAGALLAMTLGPAIALLGWRRTRIARAMVIVIAVALLGTLSRGGYLAAAITVTWMAGARVIRPRDVVRPFAGVTVGAIAMLPPTLGWGIAGPVATLGIAAAVWLGSGEPWQVPRRALAAAAVAAGLVVAALMATTPLGARFTLSSTDRARVWSHTAEQALERPWFGTGPGTYLLIAPAGEQLVQTRHAHNEYLQWFSETGVAGTASLIAGLALIATTIRRRARGRGAVRTAAVAGLAGFAVQSVVDFVWHVPVLVAIAFVLVAIATADGRQR